MEHITKFCADCGAKVEEITLNVKNKSDFHNETGHTLEEVNERLERLEALGINHPKVINRAFTVWGYLILVQVIITCVVLLILFLFGEFS